MGSAPADRTISTPAGQLPLSGPLRRLGARIIDSLIVGIPAGIIVGVVAAANEDVLDITGRNRFSPWGSDWTLFRDAINEGAWSLVLAILVVLLAAAAYEVILVATRGQTVGKMALNIRIIRPVDGDIPGWGPAVIRWAFPVVLSYIPLIGPILQLLDYLWLLWDPERRCLHDFAAGTRVVRTDLQPVGPPQGYQESGYPQSGYPQSGYPPSDYPQSGYPQSGGQPGGYPPPGPPSEKPPA